MSFSHNEYEGVPTNNCNTDLTRETLINGVASITRSDNIIAVDIIHVFASQENHITHYSTMYKDVLLSY